MYLTKPVIYLDPEDFTSRGVLKVFKHNTCIVMVQSPNCGHCTTAKPAFQAFAELCSAENKVKCLTIQADDKRLVDLVLKIKPSFDGYPDYFKFKNGTLTSDIIDGRDVQSLLRFSK